MSILVTGGAGYIGSATVECLLASGEEVVVLDDLTRGHRNSLGPQVPFYQGDIGDRALVTRIAQEAKVEACIHFAGLISMGESISNPALYFENNVAQGIALMGALVQVGVRRIVFSSTAGVYGEPEIVPIPEDSRQWPGNPYGWTKFFIERLLATYDTAYGLRFVSLRYFNAAGATEKNGEDHEPESHLIPAVLAAAQGRLPEVTVFGNQYPTPDGTAIGDYIHIGDLAEAHLRSLHYLRGDGRSDCFNVGTGQGYSVVEVIECARQVTGREIRIRQEAARPGDAARLVADSSRAQAVLGWKPQQSDLRAIIQSAWTWRQRHPHGYSHAA